MRCKESIMELIEVSDQGFLPVSTALGGWQNLILQGFRPAHFVNDGSCGGDTYELIEEFPATGVDGQASFVQVVEPSPTVIVNYIIGENGSLIPVYDSLPIDNTVTIVTGASEHVSEVIVPPHILDHMYAKKPKEPGSETTAKPRKRVKKKEPPPPATNDYVIPEIIAANTTKVNIIRKGQAISTPPQTPFRQLLSSRPKILQNAKSIITSPQKVVVSSISDLSSTQPIPTRTLSASSMSPSSVATSSSSDTTISLDLSNAPSRPVVSTPTLSKQTPSIYFLPPRASPSDVSNIIGPTLVGTESTKTSFIVTTEEMEGEGGQTNEMCLVLPSTSSSSPASPLTKTDVDGQRHQHHTGVVQTFQLNSDGTISVIPSAAVDETVRHGTEGHDRHQTEVYSEFSVNSFSEGIAESSEGMVGESATGGSFQIGDKKIYFSYG